MGLDKTSLKLFAIEKINSISIYSEQIYINITSIINIFIFSSNSFIFPKISLISTPPLPPKSPPVPPEPSN